MCRSIRKPFIMISLILWFAAISNAIASFPHFDSGSILQKVALDPESGYIFVAGQNVIHRLSAAMKDTRTITTGPVLDSNLCDPVTGMSCSGLQLHDNDANVLELNPGSKSLLFCGSVRQGMCSILPTAKDGQLQNLSMSNRVNYIGSRQSSYVFYGAGNALTSPLYVANTYDDRPLGISQPALSARKLLNTDGHFDIAYLHQNTSINEQSAIHINNQYKRNYLVRYIYGFEHNGFTYFLTLQRQNVDSTSRYEARLARVCQNDPGFYSYTELRLSCRKLNGVTTFYDIAQSAHLADVGEDLRSRLGAFSGEKILYVVFGIRQENSYMADPAKGSGLCTYRMSKIEQSFVKAQQTCYQGNGDLLEWILPDKNCQRDLKIATSIDTAFCGNSLNVGIDSRYSHKPNDRGETETQITTDYLVTSLAVIIYNGNTIAIMGTSTGEIVKMLVAGRNQPPYAVIPVGRGVVDPAVARDMTFDLTKDNLYVLTGNRISKVALKSCSVYKDCSECVLTQDPLECGWCNDRCTRNNECTGNFSPDSCPPVLYEFEPRSGPLQGGTQITIRGKYFGDDTASVVVAYQKCTIQYRNVSNIVCQTSEAPNSTDREIQVDVTDMTKTTERFNIRGSVSSRHVSFSYRKPVISSIKPEVGPKSGGTRLTIFGQHLDIGSRCSVQVAHRPCHVKSSQSHQVVCVTSALVSRSHDPVHTKRATGDTDTSVKGPVNVTIDSAELVYTANQFTYEDDPVIEDVDPKYSIISGGFPVTVIGQNLHIITEPQIEALVVNSDGHKYLESCEAEPDGLLMICKTPNISVTTNPDPPETPIAVDMSLILDDVAPASVKFSYYIDPVIFPFDESNSLKYLYEDDVFLTIQGHHIDYAAQESNVEVFMDTAKCNVTMVGTTVIACKPERPDKIGDMEPWRQVTVKIGNRVYKVGHLQFSNQRTDILIASILAPILGAFCILILIIWILWMKKTKRGPFRKTLPREANVRYTLGTAEIGPGREQQMYRLPVENSYWSETPQLLRQRMLPPMAREPIMDDESRRLIEDNRLLIDRDRLLLLEIIGQGHFGCVYRGFLKIGDLKEEIEVAVKTLKSLTECFLALRLSKSTYTNSLDAKKFLQEALRMREFDHPHILRLIGIALDKEELPLVVLPFMKHGDLLSYIRNEANSPTVKNLIDFGIQIAEGMAYLANLKFVHRDLAARNCMLDDNMNVKVADFGLSRDIYERDYYSCDDRKAKLPVKWMSLDSLEKGIYNTKTDVWSYGVVLWELMTRGVCPYPDVDNWDIIKYLKLGRRMPQPAYCPDPLYAIMLNCWDVDAKQRPTFSELVHDVKSIIVTMQQMQQKVDVGATYVNVPSSQGYLYPQPTNSRAMSTLV